MTETGRLIAIASGKGGVGKTWLSITLAQALARAGRRVLLVDGDLGLANVDVQLGLDPARDLAQVLGGSATVAEAALRFETGLDILPGRSGSGSLAGLEVAARQRLAGLLREAAGAWQAVVLDLGAGLEGPVRHLAAAVDTVLVVATDEPTSLTDAYAAIKLLHRDRPGADARIVVNQAADAAGGQRTYRALSHACRTFLGREVPLAGVVRRDDKVRDAIRRQVPLLTRHPGSPAALAVEAMARDLMRAPPGEAARPAA